MEHFSKGESNKVEINIEKIDSSRGDRYSVDYQKSIDGKYFVIWGTLIPYNTGRGVDYEFNINWTTDDESMNYFNDNAESIKDEILLNFYSLNFRTGGKVGEGYMVFNYTDNIYASPEIFKNKKDANEFIKIFRKRYEHQGYYRDNQRNKLKPSEIDLLSIPEGFSPFKKLAQGSVLKRFKSGGNMRGGSSSTMKAPSKSSSTTSTPSKSGKSNYMLREAEVEADGGGVDEDGGRMDGGVDADRMYNFLTDDLDKLEKAIKEGNKEEVERFFSYWGYHLKSLKTESNDRMYNFLKDDLKKLENAVSNGDNEEVDRFFSYWNQHLKSLKMANSGGVGEGYEFIQDDKKYSNGGGVGELKGSNVEIGKVEVNIVYDKAKNMSEGEFHKLFATLNTFEKEVYYTLIRLGDSKELALATIIYQERLKYEQGGGIENKVELLYEYQSMGAGAVYPIGTEFEIVGKAEKGYIMVKHPTKEGRSLAIPLSKIKEARSRDYADGKLGNGGGVGCGCGENEDYSHKVGETITDGTGRRGLIIEVKNNGDRIVKIDYENGTVPKHNITITEDDIELWTILFAKGGGVGKENKEMVLNQNKQIHHHTEELHKILKKDKTEVPAWVVSKVGRATTDLSDATHYLEGSIEKAANRMKIGTGRAGNRTLDFNKKMIEIDRNPYANGGSVSDLQFTSKTLCKSKESKVKQNLINGEISVEQLKSIIGKDPEYPKQIVGSLKLEKCFLRHSYKISY